MNDVLDGAMPVVRTVTELGSFALLVFAVVMFFLRSLPRHFEGQERVAKEMRAALLEQRSAHSEERAYMRATQERQHQQNVDALEHLARAVMKLCRERQDRRTDPDHRPREGQ